MTDYSQVVNDYITAGRSQVVAGVDANPDEAARNVELESATGVPSQVISLDQDNFEKQHQRALATTLVSQNSALLQYVHSHPMAASVSNDDWGNLAEFSQQAQYHAATLGGLNAPWQRAFDTGIAGVKRGFQEGFGELPTFQPGPIAAGNLVQSAGLLGKIAYQGMSGLFSAITTGAGEAVRGAAEASGMDKQQAQQLGREVSAMTEYHMITPGGDFIAAHQEPPRGIHPEVDALKAQVNAEGVGQLDSVLSAAQASLTKERSPEMFQRFVEQHYGNSTIGIHGDSVAALYGDKSPDPNDGLLGWVPGIADKLELARTTGADVEVPVADWISRVDPAVAKQLHDDIRVWPGGITAREALEPTELKNFVDSPLAQVRGSYGLEPMFSMGDRKLQLIKTAEDTIPSLDEKGNIFDKTAHLYNILDENGNPVGELHLEPEGKNIHVSWIGGAAGQWANSFGPGLMRDLLRQVKALYPEAETLSGYRVSGSRKEMAGESGPATVRLAEADDAQKFGSILTDAYRPIETGIEANIQPSSVFLQHEKEMAAVVHDELTKITGGKAKIIPTAGIRYEGFHDVRGVFFPRASLIMYDLLDRDPVGIGRHEAIHFLRDQGLFSDKEWKVLTDAAYQEGWLPRYQINDRYGQLAPERQVEEAIAEAFREWAGTADEARRQYSPVAQIFQKLWDFLQRIRGKIGDIFGRVPSAEELFSRTSTGEIGQRASEGTGGTAPLFSTGDLDNLKANALGLDLKTFQNIQKLVQERYRQDVEASQRVAEREQARRQTTEWKDNKKEMAKEVEATIRQRPDVAADLFLGSGELYGEKLRQRFTLAAGDLTAEQKAALPAHYVSKSGFPVDEVAKLFGYTSGDAMVDSLAAYHASKGDRTPQEMLRYITDTETDRQMEAKYGNLAQNILSEAHNQALSENDLNLLIEEYHAAALQAGITGVDKFLVQDTAKDLVSKMPLGEIDFQKQMLQIGRHYKDAVRALAAGDPASAVTALEKRTLAGFVAAEMRKVQDAKAKFDAVAKRYARPWDPTKPQAVSPDYNLFIRDMLSQVGLRYGMSVPGKAKAIGESGYAGLGDFVTKTENENKVSGLALPVPDWLLNPGPKPKNLDTMTVGEFQELRDAVTVMDKVGRAEQKIIKAGEAQDRKDWISAATTQLKQRFDPVAPTKPGGVRQAASYFYATTMSNETRMSRFDGRDPHGIFTETITKPAAEAANAEARMERELAARYRELGPIKDADRTLDSPFVNPTTGRPIQATRRTLAVVISNMGNNYNWKVLAKGWGVDPDFLWQWVEKNATVEDLERAQKLSNIFKDYKAQSDLMYGRMYGIAPENIVPRPFTMLGKQWDGWYHPIIGDPQLSRFVNKMPDAELEHNFWPSPSNSYTKRRTGAIQVVDLTYDRVPAELTKIVHDIAFREVVANNARIFKDNSFRQAVTNYYGLAHMQDMDVWNQRIAGMGSYSSAAMRLASEWSNKLRQNVISTAIAFNPSTVEKHGLTAAVMSARELHPNLLTSVPSFAKISAEVAPSLFKRAVADMFGMSPALGDSLFDFIKKNSEEIQRRDRNFRETIGGQQGIFEGQSTFRQRMMQTGAKVVAFSDMLSAAPLWLAKYRAELEANGGIHGDAVREADMAVRRAHGSTAITNLPTVASGQGPLAPWLTSLYGFMGTSMQRRIEIIHDIDDAYKLGRRGQIRDAAGMVPQILSSTAVYVVYTGLVEELITGQFADDRRGLGQRTLSFLFGSVAQTIIGLRDLAYDLKTGQESAGLVSTPIHHIDQLVRDVEKRSPLGKAHAGKLVEDTCSVIGDLFGRCPTHLGAVARYGLDAFSEYQRPRGGWDVYQGLATGSQKSRIQR